MITNQFWWFRKRSFRCLWSFKKSIRLYPEDMEQLFDLAEHGTSVEIIYEPVKIGLLAESVYVEVHKDIYNRIENFVLYGYNKLIEKGVINIVDLD